MEFKNTDRLLRLRFLSKHNKTIKAEYLKHKPKPGYVFIRADVHFHAVGKPRFIQRSFDAGQFICLHEQEAKHEDTAAYEVHWDSDTTSYYLKETL